MRGLRGRNAALTKDLSSVLKLHQKRGKRIKDLVQDKAQLRRQLHQEKKASRTYLDAIMAQVNTVHDEVSVLWTAATERKAKADAAMLAVNDQFATQVRGERAATSRANKNRERQHTLDMKKTTGSARQTNKRGTCSVERRAGVSGG